MRADQSGRGQVEEAILGLNAQPAARFPGVELRAHQDQRRAERLRFGIDHRGASGALAGRDHGAARLEIPAFSQAIGRVAAEQLHVVVVHRGDHADRRGGEDVGGVEPAAQADLDDRKVASGARRRRAGPGRWRSRRS